MTGKRGARIIKRMQKFAGVRISDIPDHALRLGILRLIDNPMQGARRIPLR